MKLPNSEPILVDTNVFIYLYDTKSQNHKRALEKYSNLDKLGYYPVITSLVFLEVLTVLSHKLGKKAALDFIDVYNEDRLQQIFVEKDSFEKTVEIFAQIKQKNISFVDCSFKAIGELYNITRIFSFDKDLKKLGLEVLG